MRDERDKEERESLVLGKNGKRERDLRFGEERESLMLQHLTILLILKLKI